ncbi:MAG: pyridoxamine 5-phosphate oxidase [Alphaproteobacteria bacterium]|nr:MAG: pyridoxamine 5-phosphate oxidase [Alphaproteobacteria bacterium]
MSEGQGAAGGSGPVRPADDEARALAARLLAGARHGALGTLTAEGAPFVSRVAVAWDGERGAVVTLVSALARHAAQMAADPRVSLLVGEPGARGDPLVHPRLTLEARAVAIPRPGPEDERLRALWLARHPKARLYIGFADFGFWRLEPRGALLNGGFGRAWTLGPGDLAGP